MNKELNRNPISSIHFNIKFKQKVGYSIFRETALCKEAI